MRRGWRSPRIAWMLWAVILTLLLFVWALVAMHPSVPKDAAFLLPRLAGSLLVVSTATVGALVASRRPENRIGWIFCSVALVWDIGSSLTEYAIYAVLEEPGALPAGDLTAWVASWIMAPTGLCLVFLLLLFPNGRLPSPRWKPVGWAAAAGIAIATIGIALTPGPPATTIFDAPPNPVGIEGIGWIHSLVVIGLLVTVGCGLAAASSLVSKLRRAPMLEQQQLKWLAYGASVVVGVMVCVWLPIWLYGISISSTSGQLVAAAGTVTLAVVPITTGIAILRYRLYEIDVIINRTLVYGSVTALLAGLFGGLSIVTQRVVLAVTGQQSEAAVVVAALVVTALFQPVRARVQIVVDRRFYRGKYNATRTLERFASQVRDKVELDQLTTELVAVVRETMQPSHASLWLRSAARHPGTPDQRA